jgi:hypothetical protein
MDCQDGLVEEKNSMIQYRSALVVSARPGLHLRFPTSQVVPTLEPIRTNISSMDANTTTAIAMFGRAWIHFSKGSNR